MLNMSLGVSTQFGSQDHLLVAQMDNARVLSNILKAVQFKEVTNVPNLKFNSLFKCLCMYDQLATCAVSSTGLKFTTEQSKCVQANAFIQAGMFQQYNYRDSDHSVFAINLNALIVGYLSCNVNRVLQCPDPLLLLYSLGVLEYIWWRRWL